MATIHNIAKIDSAASGPDHLRRRADAYLGAMPAAISGQGWHKSTYTATTALNHGFGLSESGAFKPLKAEYNSRYQ